MTFFYIGANIRWYSLLATKLLKDNCNIYAFAPFSENAKLLLASKFKNNFNSIKVIKAVSGINLEK